MLRVRDDRPLDGIQLEILRHLNATFHRLGTDYFIIGATARDIVLNHVFGIAPTRATVDIDFAIALTSWKQFQGIRQELLDSGHFRERRRTAIHSLVFEPDERGFGYPVDLIPFGRIEDPPREIAWPPDQHKTFMSCSKSMQTPATWTACMRATASFCLRMPGSIRIWLPRSWDKTAVASQADERSAIFGQS